MGKRPVYCTCGQRKFAGEDLQQRIFWDPTDPPPWTNADNLPPTAEHPGSIRVNKSYGSGPDATKEWSFEEMWGSAVFELYNITSAKDFERLHADAAAGRLSKPEFVTKVYGVESRAAEQTRTFYIHVFLPWAKDHGVSTDPRLWNIPRELSDTRDAYAHSRSDKDRSYWRYSEQKYNHTVFDALVENRETVKAIELATAMLDKATTAKEKADDYEARASVYERIGDTDRSIADYSQAIQLDPKLAHAYLGRGWVYRRKGGLDKALADFSEAIRLGLKDAFTYTTRGDIYNSKGETDKAIADYTEAIRLDRRRTVLAYRGGGVAYQKRGVAYQRIGKLNEALADLSEAIRLSPTYAEAYSSRGGVYKQKGDLDKANKDFAEAEKLRRKP